METPLAEKYLEGLGLNDAARRHGERTREFLACLRRREDSGGALANEKVEAERLLQEIRAHEATALAHETAARALESALIEAGATRLQATDVTEAVATAALKP